jgi:tape measure domain-containing protein
MATDTEQLVVALEARIRDFEKNFQRASRTADGQFSRIERRARQSATRLESSLKGSVANINRALGTIGVGIGLNEIARLSDQYTRFTNQLKVAGLEGNRLTATQNKLYAIAQKYGVQLEAVGTLYGRNSAAAKELGLSQAQQLKVIEATSAALKVNGTSSQEASGALLQLSQLLGGTVVQAQEYNSLIDGARPLLQAVANGSDRWGGSVAKLTQDVKAGKVTVAEFTQALLKGSNALIKQAKDIPLTISASMTTLGNAFSRYIGQLNEATGLTATFGRVISGAADHIGSIADAAAAAAAVILSRYVPGLARAALAQTAMVATNPFLLLATAIGAAAFAVAEFGDKIHPIAGDLANLQDYAAAAWTDIKAGVAVASSAIETGFLNAINLVVRALDGTQVSMADVAEAAKNAANLVINAFGLVYDTIVITFTKLPAAIADAVLTAINGLIAEVESGLNAVIHGVNAAVEAINSVGEHVGVTLGTIGDVSLGRIRNGYAGAGKEAGDAYIEALRNATKDRIGAALDTLRKQANEHARQRENAPKPTPEPDSAGGTPTATPAAVTNLNAFDRQVRKIRERTAVILADTAARRNATGSYAEQEAAAEKARVVQDLLNAAQRAGITITDDVKSKIATLADAYSAASEQAKALAKSQGEAARNAEQLEDSSKDALKGFVADLKAGKSPADALLSALGKLSDKLLDMALDGIWESIFGPSRGNNIFSTIGKALTPSVQPAATAPATVPLQSIAKTAEQTFAAPVGKVVREALAPIADATKSVTGLRGTIGPDIARTGTATDALTKLASGGGFAGNILSAKGNSKGFVNAFYQTGRSLGLNDQQARLMAAQAALESGNGKHAPGNNFFGIKAGKSWTGDTQRLWTTEEVNGQNVRMRQNFRKYASPEDAIQDRIAFMRSHFGKSWNSPDIGSAVANLQHGRYGAYATDSGYAGKLSPYLNQIDNGAAQKAAEAERLAQQRLAQQMAATERATQQMQPPLQGIGQAATQVVPSLGSMTQGVDSLLQPLTQAVPGLGQFGGALTGLIQKLLGGAGGGVGSIFGSLLGLAGGGEVSGPGTSTSDSIPTMLSDGEFVVNARATKKHRAALEAINAGRAPALASGGLASRNLFAPSSTYAPRLSINVAGSGNPGQDSRLATAIAEEVDRTLTKHKPDSFRRSDQQKLGDMAFKLRRAGARQG